VGYLYDSPFDPSNPLTNLITDNDDDDSVLFSLQFRLEAYLLTGRTYILVVTSHLPSVTGTFSVSAVGPASVSLTSISASTSQPIITRKSFFLYHSLSNGLTVIFLAPPVPIVSTSYSGALLPSSEAYTRPDGDAGRFYYFQTLHLTVPTFGLYSFTSDSLLDTVAYLYFSSFDPSAPLAHLIFGNDDDGDRPLQFRIDANLFPGNNYFLVVTTHWPSETGAYTITAVGPDAASLIPATAVTSQPIITRKFLTKTFFLSIPFFVSLTYTRTIVYFSSISSAYRVIILCGCIFTQ